MNSESGEKKKLHSKKKRKKYGGGVRQHKTDLDSPHLSSQAFEYSRPTCGFEEKAVAFRSLWNA